MAAGKLKLPNGTEYSGGWADGQRHGEGALQTTPHTQSIAAAWGWPRSITKKCHVAQADLIAPLTRAMKESMGAYHCKPFGVHAVIRARGQGTIIMRACGHASRGARPATQSRRRAPGPDKALLTPGPQEP